MCKEEEEYGPFNHTENYVLDDREELFYESVGEFGCPKKKDV